MSVYSLPSQRASLACAQWLSYCLSIGWHRSTLDKLESLWWKYHDFQGRLIDKAKGAP